MVFGQHVANTMGKGLIDVHIVDPMVIFGALAGAIFWNVVTWIYGIPSSSSHALVGGLVGAGIAKAGFGAVIWSGLGTVAMFIVLSPLIGLGLAVVLVIASSWSSVRLTPFTADRRFRVLQFVSSSLFSLGHGGNDAQKTMGIIAILLYSQGLMPEGYHVPFWVIIACQTAMAIGTFSGGWRIVKTVGSKITDLKPIQGFCAETGGAMALFGATWLGIPVSTTHTIIGAVVGVGAMNRTSAVRWGTAGNIVVAWVITLPAAAAVGAAGYWAASLLG
jgi:PiT family inorganic phosphate transporter